jgi:hypothetical protein
MSPRYSKDAAKAPEDGSRQSSVLSESVGPSGYSLINLVSPLGKVKRDFGKNHFNIGCNFLASCESDEHYKAGFTCRPDL